MVYYHHHHHLWQLSGADCSGEAATTAMPGALCQLSCLSQSHQNDYDDDDHHHHHYHHCHHHHHHPNCEHPELLDVLYCCAHDNNYDDGDCITISGSSAPSAP